MVGGRGNKREGADVGTARQSLTGLASRQREARFWVLAAVAWVILLYGTLGIVRPLTTWLRDHDLLRLFLVCVVAAVVALDVFSGLLIVVSCWLVESGRNRDQRNQRATM